MSDMHRNTHYFVVDPLVWRVSVRRYPGHWRATLKKRSDGAVMLGAIDESAKGAVLGMLRHAFEQQTLGVQWRRLRP